jgi:hypothetical protein
LIFVYQQADADHYFLTAKVPSTIGAHTSAYFGQVGKHTSCIWLSLTAPTEELNCGFMKLAIDTLLGVINFAASPDAMTVSVQIKA